MCVGPLSNCFLHLVLDKVIVQDTRNPEKVEAVAPGGSTLFLEDECLEKAVILCVPCSQAGSTLWRADLVLPSLH